MEVLDGADVTSTSFRAVVREGAPYCFSETAMQDTQSSVRLTHIAYTPPTSHEEWCTYCDAHAAEMAALHTTQQQHTPPQPQAAVMTVTAEVQALVQDGAVRSFVVAAFPLDLRRVPTTSARQPTKTATTTSSSSSSPALSLTRHDTVPLPVDSDVAANLHICLDTDGATQLRVRGPGTVVFYGEQHTALIPEWLNHHMFTVDANDEEDNDNDDKDDGDDESVDMTAAEMAELRRLARR